MTSFQIRIADFVFDVEASYAQTKEQCLAYLTDDSPEITLSVTAADIHKEREACLREALYEGLPAPDYPPEALESTALYRKIAEYISYHDAAVFHGALISVDNRGVLFTAASGTGKTTHIGNWKKEYPDCRIINGDKPILRVRDNHVLGCGTPWAGKEGLQENACVPLEAIVLLERAKENSVREIPFAEALSMLISQTYRPEDENGMLRVFRFAEQLSDRVRFYRLGCTMDSVSAVVAREGILGQR